MRYFRVSPLWSRFYGLFEDPSTIVTHVDTIAGLAPGGAIDVIRDQLTRLSAQGSTTLGVSFLIGLVISLWSANSGIKALFDSLNVVYEEEEKRSFIRLNALTLTFTIATIAFLLIALASVVALPVMPPGELLTFRQRSSVSHYGLSD